jgi:hypothetical protein
VKIVFTSRSNITPKLGSLSRNSATSATPATRAVWGLKVDQPGPPSLWINFL